VPKSRGRVKTKKQRRKSAKIKRERYDIARERALEMDVLRNGSPEELVLMMAASALKRRQV
jgi:hypothetical protein